MKIARLISALLCFTLLFTACGNAAKPLDEAKVSAPATKGRYLERDVDFPAYATVYALQQVAADTFYALGQTEEGEPVEAVRSIDGGATWTKVNHADLTGYGVMCAAFLPDGRFYVNYSVTNPENPDDVSFRTALVDETGVAELTEIPELASYFTGMIVTTGGKLLLDQSFSFLLLDPETGESKEFELAAGQTGGGNYTLTASSLAAFDGPEIALFDLETGERTNLKTPEGTSSWSVLEAQGDGSGLFYANQSGLYRITMDGAITEQLIDGRLAGFGTPSAYLMQLFACEDGSFLTLTEEGGSFRLARYVFDPEAAREPTTQLTAYSLYGSTYLQQMIGMYQKENPDVMVNLEIAREPGVELIAADALRALSTALLAGNGPDLFMLDGLPVDGYIRQNALADLAPAIADIQPELLENVVRAYTGEGGLYAIPARVSVPVLAGVGVERVDSLAAFVSWLEEQPKRNIGLLPDTLMEEFYPVCSPGWFEGDGSLDAGALAADLTELRRLSEVIEVTDLHPGDMMSRPMFWLGDALAVIFGQIDVLEDSAYVFSAIDERGVGTMKPFPGVNGGCLVPSCILGVNAASEQTDLALGFVRFTLEAERQKYPFGTGEGAGMPVNRVALDAVANSEEPGTMINSIHVSYNDAPEEFGLDTYWPTDERMSGVIDMAASIATLSPNNEVVRQMVLEETAGLFTRDKTVNEVVAALGEKVERYLQE